MGHPNPIPKTRDSEGTTGYVPIIVHIIDSSTQKPLMNKLQINHQKNQFSILMIDCTEKTTPRTISIVPLIGPTNVALPLVDVVIPRFESSSVSQALLSISVPDVSETYRPESI